MRPIIRSLGDVVKPQINATRPQQVKSQQARWQQTYRGQVLSTLPRIQYARQAMKKNLATLSQKL